MPARSASSAESSDAGAGVVRIDAALELRFTHRLRFTRGAFDPGNPVLPEVLEGEGEAVRLVAFVDDRLVRSRPELSLSIERFFAVHRRLELALPLQFVAGGESTKNEPEALRRILRAIHEAHLCRHSYVLAIGGGALLDAVGYAAATAHRGVRLVRLPTTTLAQCDSGVGVKNGVNAFGKKNYLGVFTPPWAVVNDEDLLRTLLDRDWRCGFAEAVKVSLLKDPQLFTALCDGAEAIARRDEAAAIPALRRSALLHLDHIVNGGDPFEITASRPLDFGHWSAHKLEQISGFTVRHGEAVAIGVALDVVYSALARRLGWSEAERVLGCLARLGLPLFHPLLRDGEALLQGLEEFREHLGGRLTITLLDGIGDPVEVHHVDHGTVAAAVERLAEAARLHGAVFQESEEVA